MEKFCKIATYINLIIRLRAAKFLSDCHEDEFLERRINSETLFFTVDASL
jgi:hypothetical protein